jgi:hypothetical protein
MYIKNIVIVVPTNVINERTSGKIEPVEIVHKADLANVQVMSNAPDEKKVIARISRLHKKPAISDHIEFTQTS